MEGNGHGGQGQGPRKIKEPKSRKAKFDGSSISSIEERLYEADEVEKHDKDFYVTQGKNLIFELKLQKKSLDSVQDDLDGLDETYQKLVKEHQEQDLKCKQEKKELQTKLKDAELTAENFEHAFDISFQKRKEADEQVKNMATTEERLRARIDELEKEVKSRDAYIQGAEQDNDRLQGEAAEKGSSTSRMHETRKQLQDKLDKAKVREKSTNDEIKSLKTQLRNSEKKVKELENGQGVMVEDCVEFRRLKAENDDIKKALETCQKEIDGQNQQIQDLETEVAMLKKPESKMHSWEQAPCLDTEDEKDTTAIPGSELHQPKRRNRKQRDRMRIADDLARMKAKDKEKTTLPDAPQKTIRDKATVVVDCATQTTESNSYVDCATQTVDDGPQMINTATQTTEANPYVDCATQASESNSYVDCATQAVDGRPQMIDSVTQTTESTLVDSSTQTFDMEQSFTMVCSHGYLYTKFIFILMFMAFVLSWWFSADRTMWMAANDTTRMAVISLRSDKMGFMAAPWSQTLMYDIENWLQIDRTLYG